MEGFDPRAAPVPHSHVEIVYGKTGIQVLRQKITRGTTLRQAIEQSGILALHPEIDLNSNAVGIFSKKRGLHELVRPGDRIEIYQPLKVDPKEARRRRAKK